MPWSVADQRWLKSPRPPAKSSSSLEVATSAEIEAWKAAEAAEIHKQNVEMKARILARGKGKDPKAVDAEMELQVRALAQARENAKAEEQRRLGEEKVASWLKDPIVHPSVGPAASSALVPTVMWEFSAHFPSGRPVLHPKPPPLPEPATLPPPHVRGKQYESWQWSSEQQQWQQLQQARVVVHTPQQTRRQPLNAPTPKARIKKQPPPSPERDTAASLSKMEYRQVKTAAAKAASPTNPVAVRMAGDALSAALFLGKGVRAAQQVLDASYDAAASAHDPAEEVRQASEALSVAIVANRGVARAREALKAVRAQAAAAAAAAAAEAKRVVVPSGSPRDNACDGSDAPLLPAELARSFQTAQSRLGTAPSAVCINVVCGCAVPVAFASAAFTAGFLPLTIVAAGLIPSFAVLAVFSTPATTYTVPPPGSAASALGASSSTAAGFGGKQQQSNFMVESVMRGSAVLTDAESSPFKVNAACRHQTHGWVLFTS